MYSHLYTFSYRGTCDQNAGTRDAHSVRIRHNIMSHNETTKKYKWKDSEASKLQKQWHTDTTTCSGCKPTHHPDTYLEFELVDKKSDQYQFLIHSRMSGKACRPTLKIQFFPGMGPLGEIHIYNPSEPAKPDPTPQHRQMERQSGI